MKQIWFLFVLVCLVGQFAQSQRKTTYVHSYYRKDGTYVSGYTRHYNTGTGSYSYGTIGSVESSVNIEESTLYLSPAAAKFKTKNIGGIRILPTILSVDTAGISVLIGVLRYHDSVVVDICPLPRSILTYEIDESHVDLLFKIPKDKLAVEDVIELVSKYNFELKDGFLRKFMYLNIGKNELPKFMTLKIESLTLK